MISLKNTLGVLALSLMSLGSAAAATNALGLDSGLNLLTFGDLVATSDTEGRVAVGGNAIFSNYSINEKSRPGTALTVAGNLTWNGGTIKGDTVVGGNFTTPGATFNGELAVGGNMTSSGWVTLGGDTVVRGNWSTSGAGVNGTVAVGGNFAANNQTFNDKGLTVGGTVSGLPTWDKQVVTKGTTAPVVAVGFDFAAEKARLTSLSTSLSNAAVTGSVLDNTWGTLTFDASSNSSGINIFDITAAQAGMNMILTGLGVGGSVIINVSGTTVNFGNHGFDGLFQGDQSQVLFNLTEATTVNLNVVQGSILAPNAAAFGSYGVVNGQVIVNSWSGGVQVNDVAFVGAIPVTAVPEPETYAMLVAGLGLMGLVARRRKLAAA
jgi:choice-of-anchor A domain-containing protein